MSHAPSWMPQQWTCANATAELFAYCASPPSHSSSAIDDGVVCRPAVEALWDSWSACACCTCILITRLQLRFVCTNVLHEALQYRRSCMSRQDLAYRPIVPEDLHDLRAAHQALFPIDYESHFYECVIHSRDNIFSWAAVCRDVEMQSEVLVGFVTARTFRLYDCSLTDKGCMGLESRLLDQETVVYILTLGVTDQYRHLGIASQLIQRVIAFAQHQLCRAVYLHVIEYNLAALSLYRRSKFEELAVLRNYFIGTGRQPDPDKHSYDAFLYAFLIDISYNASPLAFLNATYAPFRSLLGQLQACMPWAPRHSNYFSHAVRQRSYGPIKPARSSVQPQDQGMLWRMFSRNQ